MSMKSIEKWRTPWSVYGQGLVNTCGPAHFSSSGNFDFSQWGVTTKKKNT